MRLRSLVFFFFFFNDTATTEIYTLSLHDALPISFAADGADPLVACKGRGHQLAEAVLQIATGPLEEVTGPIESRLKVLDLPLADRKSTRLNSSHSQISYAVLCLKKKTKQRSPTEC